MMVMVYRDDDVDVGVTEAYSKATLAWRRAKKASAAAHQHRHGIGGGVKAAAAWRHRRMALAATKRNGVTA